MRLNITSMQASELIEHLKSYIDITGGDCEVRVFDKINCHTYDIRGWYIRYQLVLYSLMFNSLLA